MIIPDFCRFGKTINMPFNYHDPNTVTNPKSLLPISVYYTMMEKKGSL